MNGSRLLTFAAWTLLAAGMAWTSSAQVPLWINYQGRIVRGGTNFDGVAQFKFKLLNADGTAAFWSNDGSGGAAEPSLAVPISVNRGLFYARLGDTNLANMTPLSASVFTNADLRLRIWVDSGSGFELIAPDQPMAAVGYSMMSANISDAVVTPAKFSSESRAFFVQSAGGAMTGPLTNAFGFYGVGGALSNTMVQAASNGLSVGGGQLAVVSNRVGIGTIAPSAVLEVTGGGADGIVAFMTDGYAVFGTNVDGASAVTSGVGNVYIQNSVEVGSNIHFHGSGIVFPDATIQTTAYTTNAMIATMVGGECDTNRVDILFTTNYVVTGVKVLQTPVIPQTVYVYTNGVLVDTFALTTDRVSRVLSLGLGTFDRLGIACTNVSGTVLFSFEGRRL